MQFADTVLAPPNHADALKSSRVKSAGSKPAHKVAYSPLQEKRATYPKVEHQSTGTDFEIELNFPTTSERPDPFLPLVLGHWNLW
jgi:hypothetical protein